MLPRTSSLKRLYRDSFGESRHTNIIRNTKSVSNPMPLARTTHLPSKLVWCLGAADVRKGFLYQSIFFALNISMLICNAATFSTEMQNVPKEHMSIQTSLALASETVCVFLFLFFSFSPFLFSCFFFFFNRDSKCLLYACETAIFLLSSRIINLTAYRTHYKTCQVKYSFATLKREATFWDKELKMANDKALLNSTVKWMDKKRRDSHCSVVFCKGPSSRL